MMSMTWWSCAPRPCSRCRADRVLYRSQEALGRSRTAPDEEAEDALEEFVKLSETIVRLSAETVKGLKAKAELGLMLNGEPAKDQPAEAALPASILKDIQAVSRAGAGRQHDE